jgi:hypothetical protein
MFDAGPSLAAVLVLGLGPAGQAPPPLLEPAPDPGAACVQQVLPSLYLGGRLEPCAEAPRVDPRRTPSPLPGPLDLLGHSASDE